jgi:hypothetical protein
MPIPIRKRKPREVKHVEPVVPPMPRFAEAGISISALVAQSAIAPKSDGRIVAALPPPPEPVPVKPEPAIPLDIFRWMKGEENVPPARLAKMMGDISNKMGYYLAYTIIQRMDNFSALVQQLNALEEKLLINKSYEGLNDAQLFTHHSRLKHTISDFMEFARRFSVEAKDIIIDPERDELVNMVRSLDADGLRAIKELLAQVKKDRSGSSTGNEKGGMRIEDFEKGQGKL